MTAAEVVREDERRTSYLELFFDLVFVFAVTQVTTLVLDDTSAAGLARSALLFGLLWWAWSAYAWLTNAVVLDQAGVRLLLLAATAASFFMALAVPRAYEDEGLWFAVPYVVVRAVQLALYTYGLRGDRAHLSAVLKLAPWFAVAPVIVLAGGALDPDARPWLWLASLAIDVGGALSVGAAGFRISPAHFAERYALFVIIALGESIVAIGVGAAEVERDSTFAAAVVVAFGGVAALWWAYFDFIAPAVEQTLRETPEERRAPMARDVLTLFHYPIVFGIVLYAVAAKKVLAEPSQPLSEGGRAALALGVALYLAGFALGRYRARRSIAWERIAGAAATVVVVVLLDGADALVVLALVVVVMAVTTVAETARLREARARIRG